MKNYFTTETQGGREINGLKTLTFGFPLPGSDSSQLSAYFEDLNSL